MSKLVRYLFPQVRRDLARKMVFVAGPRQVGKTTLARSLDRSAAAYLNWDITEQREREVDFVITERGRPIKLVECKWSDADVDSGLRYLHAKYPSVEAWQCRRMYLRKSGFQNRHFRVSQDLKVSQIPARLSVGDDLLRALPWDSNLAEVSRTARWPNARFQLIPLRRTPASLPSKRLPRSSCGASRMGMSWTK